MAKRGRKTAARKPPKRKSREGAATKPPRKQRRDGPAPASVAAGVLATVNRIELAELMGVHPDTISDYVRQGMPAIDRGGHGKEGAYDPVAALRWHRVKFPPNPKDLAMARQAEANAMMTELKLKERMLDLVPRDQVEREGRAMLAALAAEIRMVPSQLSQAGVITREQEAAAEKICRNLLSKIATWSTLEDLLRAAGAA